MHFRKSLLPGLIAVTGLFATAAPALASSLYIDFGSSSAAPSSLFGAAAGTAGVWNNVSGLGTVADLFDAFGVRTDVDVTVSAESADGTGGGGTTDAYRLMQDNFYSTPGKTWSVWLSGLTDGLYDVYLYEPMNMFLGTGTGAVNGQTFSNINGNFGGTFIKGGNYLLLSDVLVTNGTLSATGGETGALSGLAGLQLVDRRPSPTTPVPEPGTLLLLSAGLAAAGVRRRRAS
jgi:hypothetical protein